MVLTNCNKELFFVQNTSNLTGLWKIERSLQQGSAGRDPSQRRRTSWSAAAFFLRFANAGLDQIGRRRTEIHFLLHWAMLVVVVVVVVVHSRDGQVVMAGQGMMMVSRHGEGEIAEIAQVRVGKSACQSGSGQSSHAQSVHLAEVMSGRGISRRRMVLGNAAGFAGLGSLCVLVVVVIHGRFDRRSGRAGRGGDRRGSAGLSRRCAAGPVGGRSSGSSSSGGGGKFVGATGGRGQGHRFAFQGFLPECIQLEGFAVLAAHVHEQTVVGDAKDPGRLRRGHLSIPDVVKRFSQVPIGPSSRWAASRCAVLALASISCAETRNF